MRWSNDFFNVIFPKTIKKKILYIIKLKKDTRLAKFGVFIGVKRYFFKFSYGKKKF